MFPNYPPLTHCLDLPNLIKPISPTHTQHPRNCRSRVDDECCTIVGGMLGGNCVAWPGPIGPTLARRGHRGMGRLGSLLPRHTIPTLSSTQPPKPHPWVGLIGSIWAGLMVDCVFGGYNPAHPTLHFPYPQPTMGCSLWGVEG